ncbi:DNA phosphorothioation-dependent restriction protein DptF [Methylophaga sulfidovorans]|uniref:DNA phosphorothioation-dependent restriction protein DptF n=1 Tax=Methylophaga sulfidovorans TaxID=45496 RepID=A0A1I4ACJ4_9GAMM|nr:DNA phosphorothioation-dependent restriction protein DptF [Methylophaga sulfidovorans]SFK54128.1 DNA phosphorothioation-dependent restriction protein DptF [Methylophaga sulfidovorans]
MDYNQQALTLENALRVLSKSSAEAVAVEKGNSSQSQYKSYLYIQTKVELDFEQKLRELGPGKILFLCGSSGDGKSEIMTRFSNKDEFQHIDFHLDATHSFKPNQTAIQALDQLFKATINSKRPLVVGINIGMLGNYAKSGDDELSYLKDAIIHFIEGDRSLIAKEFQFIDFEDYPKFMFMEDGFSSSFVEPFLKKLTSDTDGNPFFQLYKQELAKHGQTKLTTNYMLLSLPEVQVVLVELLIKARLSKDQFVTARTLLDFIYCILSGDNYLFDNLFLGGDNEIQERLVDFDPANIRNRNIDQFILKFDLEIVEPEFHAFKDNIEELGLYSLSKAESYIRLTYLLGDSDLSSGFKRVLNSDFKDSTLDFYSATWRLHANFDGTAQHKQLLNKFYKDTLISSLHRYCNRNAQSLDKDHFHLTSLRGYNVATTVDIRADFESIKSDRHDNISHFQAHLKVNETSHVCVEITMNLFELMLKINEGYRPNKHDKSAIILLDEILENILEIANQSDTLLIFHKEARYKIVNEENDYYEISGI